MKGFSQKPAATLAEPGSAKLSQADLETVKETHEYHIQQQQLKAKRDKEMGKVAAMLGAAVMITDKTFPFLTMNGRQLSVSEWYPGLSIAVDKFFVWEKEKESEVEFKAKLFAQNKIRYGFLSPTMELYDLAKQLGLEGKAIE